MQSVAKPPSNGTLKVIGEKGIRITPDVMASGGGVEGGGGIGSLLLLNLFRERP